MQLIEKIIIIFGVSNLSVGIFLILELEKIVDAIKDLSRSHITNQLTRQKEY